MLMRAKLNFYHVMAKHCCSATISIGNQFRRHRGFGGLSPHQTNFQAPKFNYEAL